MDPAVVPHAHHFDVLADLRVRTLRVAAVEGSFDGENGFLEIGQRREANAARRVVRQRAGATVREDPSEVGRSRPEP